MRPNKRKVLPRGKQSPTTIIPQWSLGIRGGKRKPHTQKTRSFCTSQPEKQRPLDCALQVCESGAPGARPRCGRSRRGPGAGLYEKERRGGPGASVHPNPSPPSHARKSEGGSTLTLLGFGAPLRTSLAWGPRSTRITKVTASGGIESSAIRASVWERGGWGVRKYPGPLGDFWCRWPSRDGVMGRPVPFASHHISSGIVRGYS